MDWPWVNTCICSTQSMNSTRCMSPGDVIKQLYTTSRSYYSELRTNDTSGVNHTWEKNLTRHASVISQLVFILLCVSGVH